MYFFCRWSWFQCARKQLESTDENIRLVLLEAGVLHQIRFLQAEKGDGVEFDDADDDEDDDELRMTQKLLTEEEIRVVLTDEEIQLFLACATDQK